MQDTIVCPQCKRRLVLPPGAHDIMAQCPRCKTQFASHPAEPEADIDEWLRAAPPAPDVAPAPDVPQHDFANPTAKESPSTGSNFKWTGLLVCVLIGIVRAMFSGCDSQRTPSVSFQGQHRPVGEIAEGFQLPQAKNDLDKRPEALNDLNERVKALLADLERKKAETEFVPLFDALGREFRAANGQRLTSHFDADRMAEEFVRLMLIPEMKPAEKRDFAKALHRSLPDRLARDAPALAWSSLEIRKIERLPNDEAIVLTRIATAKDEMREVRWWLVRRLNDWRVYDMEDLVARSRFSVSTGLAIP